MNRKELLKKLRESGVPEDAYSLQGGLPNECFCMGKGEKWEVYYSERGKKSQLRTFDAEGEACEYMFKFLSSIFK